MTIGPASPESVDAPETLSAVPPGQGVAGGIALFLGALVLFAFYDAFAKHMVSRYPPAVVNLSRYVTICVLALALLVRHGDVRLWRQPHQGLLALRSVALALVATCFMTALVTMPLAEATAIYFTAPLVMVALSPRMLGERVGRAQWCAVLLGFAGMLFIVRPGGDLPVTGTLLMAVAAVCYALFQVLTRRLSGLVAAPMQFAYMALACLLITGMPLAFMPHIVRPPWPDQALMLAGGAVSAGAQLLLLAAFRRVSAATLAPLNYVQLLLAVAISAFWFQRAPDALALAGMGMIALAGMYLARARRAAR